MYEDLTYQIIGAAMNVHTALGANLLESTYAACLVQEFISRGLKFHHQVPLPVTYRSVVLEAAYRIDFLVDDRVIVELKAVETLLPVHLAQMLTYLKLSEKRVGLIINFNVPHLKDGIRHVVNEYPVPTQE